MSKQILGVNLLSYEEVSSMLGVSRVTVIKYVKDGGLQARTIGARKYIAEENLQRFLLSSDHHARMM